MLGTAELLLHLKRLPWLRFDSEVSVYDGFAPLFGASSKAAYHGRKCLVEEHCEHHKAGVRKELGFHKSLWCIFPMTEDLTVGRPKSERSYYLLRLSPWDQAWKDGPSGNTQFLTSK